MLSDRANQITIDYSNLKAEITLRSSLASLTLTQRFQNSSPSPIETTYSIKEERSAVITSLKAIFEDGSITELKVSEKEQAKEKFQDKLAQGHLPLIGLIEDESIELQIGHLPAGQSLEIVTSFAFLLTANDNFWKLEMPPAFEPSPSVNFEVYLTVLSDFEILSYKSNWDFDFTLTHNTLVGIFKSLDKVYNKDRLQFSYKSSQNIKPNILVQTNGEDYAAMLSFIPYCNDNQDIDDYEPTDEFLFIVDRSGSMSGNRIELAKEAAKLFLKSLNNKSKFNIISFGNYHSFLYPNSVLADSNNVSDAIFRISQFSADMGGTEIYRPLEEIYAKNLDAGFKRFIFLLTDGDVSSPEMVVKLIETNQDKGKVFSFGIEDANEFLIRESAQKGNGESFYIKKAVDIGKNVIKALTICMSPYVDNVKIDLHWDFAPRLQNIKWINYGRRFCVFALGKEMPEGKCVLTCFDSFKGTELRFEIFSREAISGDEIFKLWAKSKIEDDPDNSLEISLKYQVISPKTAFFAYKKNNSTLTQEIIPAELKKSKPDNTTFLFPTPKSSCTWNPSQPMMANLRSHAQPINSYSYVPPTNTPNAFCNFLSAPPQFMASAPPPPPPPPPAFNAFPPAPPAFPPAPPPSWSHTPAALSAYPAPPPALPYQTLYIPGPPQINVLSSTSYRVSAPQATPVAPKSPLYSSMIPQNLPCSSAQNDFFGDIASSNAFSNYSQSSVPATKSSTADALFDFNELNYNQIQDIKIDLVYGSAPSKNLKVYYLSIVLCQDSEGFWNWSNIVGALNPGQEVIALENSYEDKAVLATCLALAYLNKFCLLNKEEWILVEKKAIKWLKKKYLNYVDLIERFSNVIV